MEKGQNDRIVGAARPLPLFVDVYILFACALVDETIIRSFGITRVQLCDLIYFLFLFYHFFKIYAPLYLSDFYVKL